MAAALAPMLYSPPMAYSLLTPYAAPAPPSYAPPSYDAPYNSYDSPPMLLAPLVEDPSARGGGGGGGGLMTKFFALPGLFPILFPGPRFDRHSGCRRRGHSSSSKR